MTNPGLDVAGRDSFSVWHAAPRGNAAVAGERLRLPARLSPILAMFTATFVAIAATLHPVAPVLHGISLMTQSVTLPVESRRGPFVFLGGLRMSVFLQTVSFLLQNV